MRQAPRVRPSTPRPSTPRPFTLGPLANPLVVTFWLLGLDAAHGLLRARGFARSARELHGHPRGSSCYTLGALHLHSSGLCLVTPSGPLRYTRARGTFTLNGSPLRRADALALLRPHLLAHEAWVEARHPGLRARQLAAPMPGVVRRQVEAWQVWTAPGETRPALPPLRLTAPRTAGTGRTA